MTHLVFPLYNLVIHILHHGVKKHDFQRHNFLFIIKRKPDQTHLCDSGITEQHIYRRETAALPPNHMLPHISLICSTVGIIDPEQLLHWVLSFFFSSVPRSHAGWGLPLVSEARARCGAAGSLWRRLTNEVLLNLWRLHRHLFSLFWQPVLRSSPLQASLASLCNTFCTPHPPFIWSSSWVRCNDVFQSQLPASEGGFGGVGGATERHFLT